MRKVLLIAVGVLVVALAAVAVWVLLNPDSMDVVRGREVLTDAKAINKAAVGYVQNPYKDDYQMARIPGYVDNLTTDKLKKVVFEIRLIDQKGNKRERVYYTLYDVPAKSRKTFDANAGPISGSRNAEVKITQVEVVK